MQKPLYTMPEIIDRLNELDNPKQTIEDQGYTLWPFYQKNLRLSNNVMKILLNQPINVMMTTSHAQSSAPEAILISLIMKKSLYEFHSNFHLI